ncbi:acetyltransferase (GNAT) family protein [Stackebrandtia albiflava]|uniref:Acetyltransferase (GNAT) family protein n=1 Tax=Stackebrandtia albiflava TaxID=406432 RepID=A0A562V411_9ACTN|nr:GNAT family N-acetyltransferase [Stackebrandtia albiflava]TWJ12624.1 acetyltransferase (GNAT) family protein [Stackebrandtia albiflava]
MSIAIQDYARAAIVKGGHSHRIGPFTVRFDPDTDHPFLNYAIPDNEARPTTAEVDALVTAFTTRGLRPRAELLPEAAPAVEAALAAAGLVVEARSPLMTCAPGEAVTAEPAGVRLYRPTRSDEYLDAVTIQYAAFGETDTPGEAEAHAQLAGPAERGAVVVVAAVDDRITGVGLYGAPVDGIAEVAGIAVAPSHQGRGIGAAITGWLTRHAHDAGVHTAWLDPSGDTAQRLYRRAGYRVSGTKLHMSVPA